MKQQINLLLLCLVLLSLVRNVVPKGAPDNDAPEHIFGTYDEDGKYHKEINFADLDTVPETITLTAYDAVVDDPITTQAIPTPSTLLGPLLGPSAESSADIDFFNLDLELKDFLLDDLEAASSSSAHGGATALLQMNTNQRHAKAKRKVHAKSNAKSQTQKQAQHQRKHTQQTHAIARANVTAEFKPVEQYEYIGQYKKDKLLGQGKFGEVWSFTVPDRPDLPGVVAKFPKAQTAIESTDRTVIAQQATETFIKADRESSDECAFAQKIAKAYPGSFLFMQCYMYKAAKAWGSDGRDDEIVMVLEHGGPTTIREAMEAEAVTDDDAVMIMHQLITALGKLRALHLTHHDLKIGNIMFAKEVNEQGKDVVHIKLVDYGAMYDYNLGTRKKLVTTRSFAPPEYLQSKITDRWRFDVFSAGYVGLELLHFLTKDTLRLVAMTVQDVINAQRAAGEMDPAQRARVNEIAANYKKHVQALTEKLVDLKIAVFEYKETRNANARKLVSRHCSFMLYLFKNMCQLQGLDYQTHPGAQSMVAYATDFASLLQKMLFANPKERLSPAALLQHPFFLRHMPAHYAAEIETFYNEPASVVERPADSQVQSVVSALRASPTDRARRHVSWGADRVHNVENTHYPIPKNPKGK